MRTRVPGLAAAILLAVVAVCGCDRAARRTLPDGIGSILVNPSGGGASDAAGLLGPELDEQLKRAFRFDGRLAVRDEGQDADCRLDVTIAGYEKVPARLSVNNIIQEYRLRMILDLGLSGGPGKEALWGATPVRRIERSTTFVVVPASGMPVETEQEARRRLLRELSRDVVYGVIEGR